MYRQHLFEGAKVYGRTPHITRSEVDLSYPTVQKSSQKMVDKAVLKQPQNICEYVEFSDSTNAFYHSIQNNAQIVLTFEAVEKFKQKRLTRTDQSIKISFNIN